MIVEFGSPFGEFRSIVSNGTPKRLSAASQNRSSECPANSPHYKRAITAFCFSRIREGFRLRVVRVVLVVRHGYDHLEYSRIVRAGQRRTLEFHVLRLDSPPTSIGAEA